MKRALSRRMHRKKARCLEGHAAADSITGDQPKLGAVFKKHLSCRLRWVDAHAICVNNEECCWNTIIILSCGTQ